MTMDMKAMWALVFVTLFFGIGSFQGFAEWRAAMAISEVVDAKIIRHRSMSNRHADDYYFDYSVPALGPQKVGSTEVSYAQWRNAERGDLFKIHFVADAPELSMVDPQHYKDLNVLWALLSAVSLVLAAAMACVVVFLKSPMKHDATSHHSHPSWFR